VRALTGLPVELVVQPVVEDRTRRHTCRGADLDLITGAGVSSGVGDRAHLYRTWRDVELPA
jgi:hypothetical protein